MKNHLKSLMASLNMGAKEPRCPLCHELMKKKWMMPTLTRAGFFAFICETPKHGNIGIRVDDPFVNRWEEAYHKATDGQGIPCPSPRGCSGKMRYFATSTGYMKGLCPKCGAMMSAGGTRKEGTVENVTPENPGTVQ